MNTVAQPVNSDSDKVADTLTTIVHAAFADPVRSSGSLESNGSSSSSSTAQSVPSLSNTHSTISESSTTSLATSIASSTTPSPCPSILRPESGPSRSVSSSASSSPNVTFAPLPQTDQRKRHPSHQLGVAARSRLIQHRRMLREGRIDPDDPSYHQYGPGSGVAGGKGVDGEQVQFPSEENGQGGGEYVRRSRSRTPSEPQEDPLVALGRMMKGATKTLWKSLSMRDMRSKDKEAAVEGSAAEHGAANGLGQQVERPTGSLRLKRSRVGMAHPLEQRALELDEGEEVPGESLRKLLSQPALSEAAEAAQDAEPQHRDSADSIDSVRTTTLVLALPDTADTSITEAQ